MSKEKAFRGTKKITSHDLVEGDLLKGDANLNAFTLIKHI